MGGEDGCNGCVESISRTNLGNCSFTWSGKFYICQQKVREFQKPLATATMPVLYLCLMFAVFHNQYSLLTMV